MRKYSKVHAEAREVAAKLKQLFSNLTMNDKTNIIKGLQESDCRPCKKIPFDSKELAIEANSGMETYRCPFCRKWHHTSNGGHKLFLAMGSRQEAMDWIKRKCR